MTILDLIMCILLAVSAVVMVLMKIRIRFYEALIDDANEKNISPEQSFREHLDKRKNK